MSSNTQSKTPAARWRKEGQKDPHGDQYQCTRDELPMGHLTDDELANAGYTYDHRNGLMSIAYLDAMKSRIRWLSRQLEQAREAANVGLCADQAKDVAEFITGQTFSEDKIEPVWIRDTWIVLDDEGIQYGRVVSSMEYPEEGGILLLPKTPPEGSGQPAQPAQANEADDYIPLPEQDDPEAP